MRSSSEIVWLPPKVNLMVSPELALVIAGAQ